MVRRCSCSVLAFTPQQYSAGCSSGARFQLSCQKLNFQKAGYKLLYADTRHAVFKLKYRLVCICGDCYFSPASIQQLWYRPVYKLFMNGPCKYCRYLSSWKLTLNYSLNVKFASVACFVPLSLSKYLCVSGLCVLWHPADRTKGHRSYEENLCCCIQRSVTLARPLGMLWAHLHCHVSSEHQH